MAKLTDKFFNRVIEGPLETDSSDGASIAKSLEGKDLKVKKLESTLQVIYLAIKLQATKSLKI